jgi:hypothetical protein
MIDLSLSLLAIALLMFGISLAQLVTVTKIKDDNNADNSNHNR